MNIAVVYGGTSCERDVSIITGIQALGMLDKFRYEVYPVLIGADGGMGMPENAQSIRTYIGEKPPAGTPVYFEKGALCVKGRLRSKRIRIDCALLCTHGGTGENGALQGFFEMCSIPYTSPGVEPSAICMNKITSKSIFLGLGANVLPAAKVQRGGEKEAINYAKKCGYPVIVKPARQGSSIGIDVAKNDVELLAALSVAFEFDEFAIIERALENFTEINCACVKSRGEIIVSSLERPVCWKEFLTFEDKYLLGGKSGGGKINASAREFPAKIPQDKEEYIKRTSYNVYKELGMKGVVRFDYLIDNDGGEVYLNEANTIPGSLANYLFTDKGIDGNRLMDIIIEEAVAEGVDKGGKFSSDVLKAFGAAGCEACGTFSANACKIGARHI